MFKSLSGSLIARGILAVIVGIIALAWPSVTVLALVIMFAVYAFMASGMEAARAFSSRQAGPVIGHLLLGLVDGAVHSSYFTVQEIVAEWVCHRLCKSVLEGHAVHVHTVVDEEYQREQEREQVALSARSYLPQCR
jgi:hypothetical protein